MFMNIQLSAVISWEQSLILDQDKQSLIQTTAGFAGLGNTLTLTCIHVVSSYDRRGFIPVPAVMCCDKFA